jgi:1,4-alpha-glucan branching enzyme
MLVFNKEEMQDMGFSLHFHSLTCVTICLVSTMIISKKEMEACLEGKIGDPHAWLGLHLLGGGKGVVARALDPGAEAVSILDLRTQSLHPMKCLDRKGLFEVLLTAEDSLFPYRFVSSRKGDDCEWADPYSFRPTVNNEDLKGFNEGWDRRPFLKLGSISRVVDGIEGVSFVVWAPSARSVHLVGEFNYWHTKSLPMRALGSSGCRELFVPYARVGHKYKFRVLGVDGVLREKADPFAFKCESPPGNASIVCERSSKERAGKPSAGSFNPREEPISIYEMHLGSWKFHENENRPLSYLELADCLPRYLTELSFSHVEFLPPSEYPYGASWGYQVTGFYAPTHRYGPPEDFKVLVDACKKSGIGVIVDWVPAHFPSDEFALACFDGSCLFEHEDPRQGRHAEWDTLIFNYGRPEVRSFLIGSALAWLDRFGVSGFRVDAVASMLYLDYGRQEGEWFPNREGGNENFEAIDFIRQFNQAIHEEYPEAISIAEESTAFPQITQPPHSGGLGFDFKWNMGWMHDVLGYFGTPPGDRPDCHDGLTFGATYQFSENFVQVFSHDEVVHGKGSLANKMNLPIRSERLANLRALLALQWAWPGKKTLFMGCEFGQWKEWDFDSALDWELLDLPLHAGLLRLVGDLNRAYLEHPSWAKADHEEDRFRWGDCHDSERQTLSFLRLGEEASGALLVACNFSSQLVHRDWGCPYPGDWKVLLDTDSPNYGGGGTAGETRFAAAAHACDDLPHTLFFPVGRWSVRILCPDHD